MAKKHVIDQDSNTPFAISQDDSIWILKQGVTADVADARVFTSSARNVDIIVEGQVGSVGSTMWDGIYATGKDNEIEITDTGSIGGGYRGISGSGKNLEIVNDGTISGSVAGIDLDAKNFVIRNSGTITTSDLMNGKSILLDNSIAQGKIVNETDGTIDGPVHAVNSGPLTFINKGTIAENLAAIEVYLSYYDDHFVNRGTINGHAFLGEGNDIADLRNGSVTGRVSGLGGNDTYIVNQNNLQVLEYDGDGIDTLKSSVNFDAGTYDIGEVERFVALGKKGITLIANDHDNTITGNRGKNFLDGGAGDDTVRGGKGADIFNFGTGHDSDRIMDFENGKDVVNIASWNNIDDFADIQAIVSVSGDDLVLALGNEDLTFRNMKLSELDVTDFIF